MSKKMILSALVTLAFSMNCFAAGMTKAEAGKRLNTEHAKEVLASESFKKSFDEVKGDMSKLTMKQKREFNEAIGVIASKVGIETTSLQRVFLRKADILADIIRLEATLQTGTATEKEAAKTQIELIGLVGKALDRTNYKSTEAQAATKLLQLDLTTLPVKATEVVRGVNQALAQGKSLVDSIKEGTKGIKGTLEDLINCV